MTDIPESANSNSPTDDNTSSNTNMIPQTEPAWYALLSFHRMALVTKSIFSPTERHAIFTRRQFFYYNSKDQGADLVRNQVQPELARVSRTV